MPLHDALFYETSPGPLKYAASLLGLCSSEARLPIVEIEEVSKSNVKDALKKALIESGYTLDTLPNSELSYDTNSSNKKSAQTLQQCWKASLSINVELSESDPNTHINKLINRLNGLGFNQVFNNTLQGKNETTVDEKMTIPVLNPLSDKMTHLRTSLLPGLAKNIDYNITVSYTHLTLPTNREV